MIVPFVLFFNADFKDDKSYPFLAVTTGDVFPAIKYTRERHRKDTKYFGPYTDGRAARTVFDAVRRVVPICTASCPEWRRIKRKLDKLKDDELKLYSMNYGYGSGSSPNLADLIEDYNDEELDGGWWCVLIRE